MKTAIFLDVAGSWKKSQQATTAAENARVSQVVDLFPRRGVWVLESPGEVLLLM